MMSRSKEIAASLRLLVVQMHSVIPYRTLSLVDALSFGDALVRCWEGLRFVGTVGWGSEGVAHKN